MPPTTLELTPEQDRVFNQILDQQEAVFILGGYAGTGKTTLIGHLIQQLPGWGCVAYTGKASHVLRSKGIKANTIHSVAYHTEENTYIDDRGDEVTELVFTKRKRLPFQGLIVDEASMVTKEIFTDLLSYDVPLIFVGDHGQLEPIGSDFNLMQRPDATLETIHRNAGDIAHFAERLQRGDSIIDFYNSDSVQLDIDANDMESLLDYDQVIVGFNNTRVQINKVVRDLLGHPPDEPVEGDRVMILQNDRELGVYNGMQGTVEWVDGLTIGLDTGEYTRVLQYLPEQFNREKKLPYSKARLGLPMDYCYAITCHKAQGDEWDSVLVIEQGSQRLWDQCRWNYTAASRARKKLTWVAK